MVAAAHQGGAEARARHAHQHMLRAPVLAHGSAVVHRQHHAPLVVVAPHPVHLALVRWLAGVLHHILHELFLAVAVRRQHLCVALRDEIAAAGVKAQVVAHAHPRQHGLRGALEEAVPLLRPEHGDGAVLRPQPLLYMDGGPGAVLLILADAHAHSALVADARQILQSGAAAGQVQNHIGDGPADGRAGARVLTEHRRPRLNADGLPDGTVHNGQGPPAAAAAGVALQMDAGVRHGLHRTQHHREVGGQAAGHHGVHGDLLHGGLAQHGRQLGHHVLRRQVRAPQHLVHRLPGGRHDGGAVGPAVVIKQRVQLVQGAGEGLTGQGVVLVYRGALLLREGGGQRLHDLIQMGLQLRGDLPVDEAPVQHRDEGQILDLRQHIAQVRHPPAGRPPDGGAHKVLVGQHDAGLAPLLREGGIVRAEQGAGAHIPIAGDHRVTPGQKFLEHRQELRIVGDLRGVLGILEVQEPGGGIALTQQPGRLPQDHGIVVLELCQQADGLALQGVQPGAEGCGIGIVDLTPGAENSIGRHGSPPQKSVFSGRYGPQL